MLAAAWVTAIATAGLLAGAIVTARYAIKTFRAQEAQLGLLRKQGDDQESLSRQQLVVLGLQARQLSQSLGQGEVNAIKDRQVQAEQILVWQEHAPRDPRISQAQYATQSYFDPITGPQRPEPVVVAHVQNTSGKPVTELKYRWVLGSSLHGETDRAAPLLADTQDQDVQEVPPGADPSMFNVVVYFRDANQVLWRRRARDGVLDELPSGEQVPHS